MENIDPASLLLVQNDKFSPLQLDPSLFESVGLGVAPNSFTIRDYIPTRNDDSSREPLSGLKLLAEQLDPSDHNDDENDTNPGNTKRIKINGNLIQCHKPKFVSMDSAESWVVAWELDLDQRVQSIGGSNIFDKLVDTETKNAQIPNEAVSTYNESIASQDASGVKKHPSDKFSAGKSLNGPSQDSVPNNRTSVEISLDLPPLGKRPRDIVEDCDIHEGLGLRRLPAISEESSLKNQSQITQQPGIHDVSVHDLWREAGKSTHQDALANMMGEAAISSPESCIPRPDKVQLSWETCTKFGPKIAAEIPFVSPYITEAGTPMFEAVYQKHVDYAFRFRPDIIIVPYKSIVEYTLLLLSGTSSLIFVFNQEAMEFVMSKEYIRTEGFSTASVSNLLQDMMDIGTHMKRLVSVAETCMHHPEGMGLIRIAFGRSLSSYLTFLQGTMVSLQESARKEKMNILELHHKTHDMGEILGRLARLCQCHVIHDRDDTLALRFGFHLPQGADLLSMIYNELMEEPGVSNPIWTALLTTLLDHASKPYRDILSRWLGITPSAYAGHDRSQLSQLSGSRRRSANWNILNKGDSLISIFDCHLQQSLQGLDPFGELFIQSKHSWSWDGSEPIILGDPLDYEGEFQWNERAAPPSFIGMKLAHQIVQVGKELQILVEFEPRHPLIAHDRKSGQAGTGLKWLYLQRDIARLGWKFKKFSNQVLLSVAARLESMGWISKRKARHERNQLLWRKQKLLGKQRQRIESEESSFGDSFQSEITGIMDIDANLSGFQPTKSDSFEFEPTMDPDLQGFFSLSTKPGYTKDMSLACPNMMEFLLKPAEYNPSHGAIPIALQNLSLEGPPRSRLESMAPLNILAEQCLADSIRTRASLISTCVMSLYFHDLNLLSHLDIMKRFQLLSDADFTSRLEEALFDEETGLLTHTARVTLTNNPSNSGGSATTRRDSTTSNTSKSPSWRSGPLTWPPRSGELELALRAVLLECFHPSEYQEAEEEVESDMGYMDVEESMTSIKTGVSAEDGKESTWKRKALDPHELEDMLAFAVKDYEHDSNISKDANALEALDFLYMDYKAPRPLRLLFFTPEAFDKYSRLFTFQLRLLRVDSTLKRVYQQLRVRQNIFSKLYPSLNSHRGQRNHQRQQTSSSKLNRTKRGWELEMAILHQFRFEAQQIFNGLRGYFTDVAIGSTWNTFIQRLSLVQSRIETRIISSYSGPNSDEDFDPKQYSDEQEEEEVEEEEDPIASDGLCDLVSLHEYHEYILDRMLLQSLLKRKQAPILKVIQGILSCVLKLSQFVESLPEPEEYLDTSMHGYQDDDDDGVNDIDDTKNEELRSRLVKLKSLHEKFHSLCRMLVKVLKTLDERGLGMEGVSTSSQSHATSSSSSVKQTLEATASLAAQQKFLQQLLLRLEMSGYYDNL